MPNETQNTATPATLADLTTIQAAAQSSYEADVAKELVKKYKVINKRKAQQAAQDAKVAKMFSDFDAAITAAGDNPAAVMAVIDSSNFHSRILHFTPSQD